MGIREPRPTAASRCCVCVNDLSQFYAVLLFIIYRRAFHVGTKAIRRLYCRHSPRRNILISTNLWNLQANVCTNFTESEFTLKAIGQNVFAFSKQIYEKEKMNGNRDNVGTRGKVMMCCVKRHCSVYTELYKTYLAAARR